VTEASSTTAPNQSAADVDGDGLADVVTVVDSSKEGVLSAELRVEMSRVGTRALSIYRDIPLPKVAGVVDADGDGAGEVFIEVNRERGVAMFILVRLVEDDLTELRAGDAPLYLNVGQQDLPGGGVGVYGFECRDAAAAKGREIVMKRSETQSGQTTNSGDTEAISLQGREARSVGRSSEEFASADTARLTKYEGGTCGGATFV
jgi:hypothetical protein